MLDRRSLIGGVLCAGLAERARASTALVAQIKTARQLASAPLWLPVGFRGMGAPGGGQWDATDNSAADLFYFQAPSFANLSAVKLVYAGFDMSSNGPMDRPTSATGYASIMLGGNGYSVYTSGTVASGASAIPLAIGTGTESDATAGQALSSGSSGIPTGETVSSVTAAYNTGGTLTGVTLNLTSPTTGTLTSGQNLTLSGQCIPAKFGQQRQFSLPSQHDCIVSDPIPVEIAANGWFGVRTSVTMSAAGFNLASGPAGGTRMVFNSLYEGDQRGTNLADQSLLVNAPPNSGGGFWAPVTCLGLFTTPVPAVLIMGDSIAWGTGDAGDANGRIGYVQRSLSNNVPWVSLARGSTAAVQSAHNWKGAYRLAVETGVTDLLLEWGRNDINAGVTSATLISTLQAIAAPFLGAGIRVWIFTLPPTTTSTDSWATSTNQTIANSSYNSQRVAYNAAVRSGGAAALGFHGLVDMAAVVEDPANPGKWNSAGGAWTADGIHPNSTNGHPALIAAGVVSPNMFYL